MTKRYRESVEVLAHREGGGAVTGAPAAFRWRGSTYRVLSVLGHWREDAGYWTGGGIEIPQRDLWRVEASNGPRGYLPISGVYELVQERDVWRLDRVWD